MAFNFMAVNVGDKRRVLKWLSLRTLTRIDVPSSGRRDRRRARHALRREECAYREYASPLSKSSAPPLAGCIGGQHGRSILVGVLSVCFIAVGLTTASLHAEDWPQWRGVHRDGVWTDTGVVERFPDRGLQVTWRVPIRGGFAGPAVAGGRVFVLDYEETPGSRTMDGTERLLALDEATGAVLWTQTWPATYRNISWKFANGPRTPPTVDGDRVYVLGAAGMISCLDAETGEAVWQVDTAAEYGATVPAYGVSHAPLVEGDVLIVVVGGEPDAKVVGFDKATGEERVARAGDDVRNRLLVAYRHRRGRRATVDLLARDRLGFPQSRDGRDLLGAGVPEHRRAVDRHAGAQRPVSPHQPVPHRVDDDDARQRVPRRECSGRDRAGASCHT